MDLAVASELLARLVALGAVALVTVSGGGLLAACAAVTAGTAAQFVFSLGLSRRFERFRPRLEAALARDMLRESGVISIVTLLGLVHFKVDTLLLSVLRSAADVGIYGVAYKVHEVLITFPGLFVGLLYPVFARLTREDPVRLVKVFQRAFDVLLVTSLGAALLVFVLAPDLSAVLGAPQASTAMRILALALPPVFLGLGLTHLLLAEARQRWLVPLYAFLAIANIGLNAIVIPRWSYDGAAAVTVATESLALVCLLGYWVGRRRLNVASRSLLAVPIAAGIACLAHWSRRTWMPEPTFDVVAAILRMIGFGIGASGIYAALVLVSGALPVATVRAVLPARGASALRTG
jgi:O-antigen/teichoic acid export membrane protein